MRLKLVIAGMIILGSIVAVAPGASAATKAGAIDYFYRSNSSFMSVKSRGGGGYNWTDDGCSVPTFVKVASPIAAYASWQFSSQCKQHDFGYRNFGGSLRLDPTSSRRASVDSHWLGLMNSHCGAWAIRYSGQEGVCRSNALVFYGAVRAFGKL